MYRGTTPTITITLPIETSTIQEAYVSFYQNGRRKFEKELSECTLETNKITIQLSQKETMSLAHGSKVRIQIRARLNDDTYIASNIEELNVEEILKEELF